MTAEAGSEHRSSTTPRRRGLVVAALAVLMLSTISLPGDATSTAGDPAPTDAEPTAAEPTVADATGSEAPEPGASEGERTVDDLREDIEQTDAAIGEVEEELARTREEIALVTEQVRASTAALAQLEAELAILEQQLVTAREAATTAAARTDDARAALRTLDVRLERTEGRLEERQDLLRDRAVSAFMFGEATVVDAVAGSRTVTDLVTTQYYMRTVLLADIDVVDEVDRMRVELVDARTASDRLREIVEREQLAAEQARVELEDLTTAQGVLTELAAEERARRSALLRRLEVHEVGTEAQLIELEQESVALTEELREVAWRAGAPGEGSWVWPTSGQLTSPFGYRTHPIYGGRRLHAGVDVGAPSGQEIVAANTGLVITASCSPGGYGCRVVVDHGGGFASLYAHQSSFAVTEGDVVTAGQVIGYVGSTGASTGPHLHFEIREQGAPIDPMQHFG